jgi:hypothetical protein
MPKVSGLLGPDFNAEAAHLVTDLYRLDIMTMIVLPVVFFLCTKPILLLMG